MVEDSLGGAEHVVERRSFPRRLVNLPAQFHLADGTVMDARMLNISEGGVCTVGDVSIPPGTVCGFSFRLPGKDFGSAADVDCKTRVVDCILSRDSGGFRLGLEFLGLNLAAYEAIRDFSRG